MEHHGASGGFDSLRMGWHDMVFYGEEGILLIV